MGRFTYEGTVKTDIDDRILLHVQAVVGDKLRRREMFTFTWRDDVSLGGGRTAVWMHPSASLVFTYHSLRGGTLNRRWLEALAYTANSPGGLYLVPEPEDAEMVHQGRLEHAF